LFPQRVQGNFAKCLELEKVSYEMVSRDWLLTTCGSHMLWEDGLMRYPLLKLRVWMTRIGPFGVFNGIRNIKNLNIKAY